jgi:hypothetical protein
MEVECGWLHTCDEATVCDLTFRTHLKVQELTELFSCHSSVGDGEIY